MYENEPFIPMSRALAGAARRYVEGRRREDRKILARHQLAAVLCRLGAPATAIESAVAADDPHRLPPAVAASVRERAEAARRLLRRHARSADPRYDLNRHIAIDRLLRWLDGRRLWQGEEARPPSPPLAAEAASTKGALDTPNPANHKFSPQGGLAPA